MTKRPPLVQLNFLPALALPGSPPRNPNAGAPKRRIAGRRQPDRDPQAHLLLSLRGTAPRFLSPAWPGGVFSPLTGGGSSSARGVAARQSPAIVTPKCRRIQGDGTLGYATKANGRWRGRVRVPARSRLLRNECWTSVMISYRPLPRPASTMLGVAHVHATLAGVSASVSFHLAVRARPDGTIGLQTLPTQVQQMKPPGIRRAILAALRSAAPQLFASPALVERSA